MSNRFFLLKKQKTLSHIDWNWLIFQFSFTQLIFNYTPKWDQSQYALRLETWSWVMEELQWADDNRELVLNGKQHPDPSEEEFSDGFLMRLPLFICHLWYSMRFVGWLVLILKFKIIYLVNYKNNNNDADSIITIMIESYFMSNKKTK